MYLDASCGDCAWSFCSICSGLDLRGSSCGSTASSTATATTCTTCAVAAVETDHPCYNVIFTNPKPSTRSAAAATADGSRPNRANSEAAAAAASSTT